MKTVTLVTCSECQKSRESCNMVAILNKNYPEIPAKYICVNCVRKQPKP